MKRLLSIILIFIMLCSLLVSCGSEVRAYKILKEFITVYGAEGTIYSPEIAEGNEGYIPLGLIEKMYLFSGDFPENYAIFINPYTSDFSECAVFVCDDADTLSAIVEACFERIRLLTGEGDRAFVKMNGNVVFYSTMRDRKRAEIIWREIIRKY